MRYSFIFVPVELGLEFLLTSRLRWLENELKIKTKPESVNELRFDGIPESVLEGMNEKNKNDFTKINFYFCEIISCKFNEGEC